jgi:hypothetical protein
MGKGMKRHTRFCCNAEDNKKRLQQRHYENKIYAKSTTLIRAPLLIDAKGLTYEHDFKHFTLNHPQGQ